MIFVFYSAFKWSKVSGELSCGAGAWDQWHLSVAWSSWASWSGVSQALTMSLLMVFVQASQFSLSSNNWLTCVICVIVFASTCTCTRILENFCVYKTMSVIRGTVSFYRTDEPTFDLWPGQGLCLKEQAKKFGFCLFELKLYRLAKIGGRIKNFRIATQQ